jgi:putative transposase
VAHFSGTNYISVRKKTGVPHFSPILGEVGKNFRDLSLQSPLLNVHLSQTLKQEFTYRRRVPSRLKRYYGSGDLHFITASCYQRQPFLASAHPRDLFLRVLEQVRQRYEFVVVGYVAMPEHFHLLISEPEKANPSVVIQALKLGVVRRLFPTSRKKREKWGTPTLFDDLPPKHFWQRRFYDFNVWTRNKRVEKLKYIHRNPVRRGLVETPDQWRWSSYRAYAFGEKGAVVVNDWSVLKMKIRAA